MTAHMLPYGSKNSMPAAAVAILLAFLVVVGRWSADRMFESIEASRYLDLRILAASIMVVLTLFYGKIERSSQYRRFAAIFILWFIYLLLNGGVSLSMDRGGYVLEKSIDVLLVGILLAVTFLWSKNDYFRRVLWLALLLFLLPLFLGALAKIAATGLLAGERLAVFGGGPNVFARLMGVLGIMALYGVLYTHSWAYRALAGSVYLLCFALVILSGSRGGMISFAFGCLIMAYLARRKSGITKILFIASLMIMSGAIVVFTTELGTSAAEIFGVRFVDLTVRNLHFSERDVLYQVAFENWLQHPMFGSGLGTFFLQEHVIGEQAAAYPHNIFLELLTETGLVGMIGLVIVLAFMFLRLASTTSAGDPRPNALFALFFMAAQFSGDFYDNRGVVLFGAMSLVMSMAGGNRRVETGKKVSAERRPGARNNSHRVAQATCTQGGSEAFRARLPPRHPYLPVREEN